MALGKQNVHTNPKTTWQKYLPIRSSHNTGNITSSTSPLQQRRKRSVTSTDNDKRCIPNSIHPPVVGPRSKASTRHKKVGMYDYLPQS